MWTNIYEKNMFLHEVINKMRTTLQNNLNTEQAPKKLHSIKNNLLHHYTFILLIASHFCHTYGTWE